MVEQNNTPAASPEQASSPSHRSGRRGMFLGVLLAVALLAGVTGNLLSSAFGQGFGWHHGGWRDGGMFGGPLTQITLLATKQTKEKNPTLFKAVANALDESIKVANADKRAAAVLWKEAQKAPDNVDDLVTQINDPGFEFTSEPHRIAFFAAFLNRIGTMKAKVGDWKELFWETAHQRQGD